MRIAQGGLSWISAGFTIFIILILATFFLGGFLQIITYSLSIVFFLIFLLLIIFFRDPERPIGDGITAVADGRIQDIIDKTINGGKWIRISTFMNIHNVHVNRMPLDGKILKITHIAGGYLPAYKKDSERNERLEIRAETSIGEIIIVLIAGAVARRIVPYIKEGEEINKGNRIGLIRLGSRVDIYLPKKSVQLTVSKNDRILAGVDTVATIHA
jgi:phosphatidylserine decarboxylase